MQIVYNNMLVKEKMLNTIYFLSSYDHMYQNKKFPISDFFLFFFWGGVLGVDVRVDFWILSSSPIICLCL
jgi:hypothetical protein